MTTRAIPISKSAGGTNAYSMSCERPSGTIAFYGQCQHILRAAARGTLKGFEDCLAKFNNRTCPALQMMREERAAGHAIYYEEYGILAKWRGDASEEPLPAIVIAHRESAPFKTVKVEKSMGVKSRTPAVVEFDPAAILATAFNH